MFLDLKLKYSFCLPLAFNIVLQYNPIITEAAKINFNYCKTENQNCIDLSIEKNKK